MSNKEECISMSPEADFFLKGGHIAVKVKAKVKGNA